jgi:hypothetical protein
MRTAGPALHARSLLTRLRHQLALVGFRRFRERVSLIEMLRHLDKLL